MYGPRTGDRSQRNGTRLRTAFDVAADLIDPPSDGWDPQPHQIPPPGNWLQLLVRDILHPMRWGTLEERFWAKVYKTSETGCWLWTGRTINGYGYINNNKKGYRVHVLMCEWTYGPRPPGMEPLHSCDTPNCVQPLHLHWGTHLENMQEMASRGRRAIRKHEAHHKAKVTEDQVRAIREEYAQGGITQAQLGRKYGISQGSVWAIVRNKLWI